MNADTGVRKRDLVGELRGADFYLRRHKGKHEIWMHEQYDGALPVPHGGGSKEIDPACVRDVRKAIASLPDPVDLRVYGVAAFANAVGSTSSEVYRIIAKSSRPPRKLPHPVTAREVFAWEDAAAALAWWDENSPCEAAITPPTDGPDGPVWGVRELAAVVGVSHWLVYREMKTSPGATPVKAVHNGRHMYVWPSRQAARDWWETTNAARARRPPRKKNDDAIDDNREGEATAFRGMLARFGHSSADEMSAAHAALMAAPSTQPPYYDTLMEGDDIDALVAALDTPAVRLLGVTVDREAVLRRALAMGVASMMAELTR